MTPKYRARPAHLVPLGDHLKDIVLSVPLRSMGALVVRAARINPLHQGCTCHCAGTCPTCRAWARLADHARDIPR
jgi:hypothetical protein